MSRITVVALLCAAGLAISGEARQGQGTLADLKTTAEASDYKSTSTYEDVVRFMKAVDAASPLIHYTTYGTTHEGRAMPMAVVGTGLKDASAAAVRATNKLRVHIQGNIHAGEVEGKEAAQILLREIALGQHADLLQSMVLLVTPIFNADGNEKFSLTNRGRQNGPINGMGTRANGQNININRDFMKLESPEGRAFVKLWNDYDPHFGFDLHTSDGSTHGYYLTYSPPLNPNTSASIMNLMKNDWFPFVTKTIKAEHGWDTFYYGNVAGGGRGRGRAGDAAARGRGGDPAAGGRAGAEPPTPEVVGAPAGQQMRAWATFEHVPRFHNNYLGLRNRFALLSEAYAYATFKDRIDATRYFVDAALRFAHANADRLKQTIAAAEKESIIGTTQATRAQIRRGDPIEILMGEVEPETNPLNGNQMNRRKDVVKPEKMIDMLWFEPSMTEDVAETYYLPADAKAAVELLQRHGIAMVQLAKPVTGVEQFTITSNTTLPVRNNSIDTGSHALRRLEGSWGPASGVTVPAGSWAVSMRQPLKRLAFYLLAPTSDDGLVNWNVLDELITDGAPYPIFRKK
jgi:murein tripeptide amidase MpaA